jgi:hypothetical protein
MMMQMILPWKMSPRQMIIGIWQMKHLRPTKSSIVRSSPFTQVFGQVETEEDLGESDASSTSNSLYNTSAFGVIKEYYSPVSVVVSLSSQRRYTFCRCFK